MKTFIILLKTEMLMAVREFSGVLFGILLPAGITLLLGFIYSGSSGGGRGLQQAFGGLAAAGLCSFGLMGFPLTMADYRGKKILKSFKLTPVSPFVLLSAMASSNLIFSLLSLLLVSGIAVFVFGFSPGGSLLVFMALYLFAAGSVFATGMLIAGIASDYRKAGILCSAVFFPAFFLSGTTVPADIMPRGLRIAAEFLPLTQAVKLLSSASQGLPLDRGAVIITAAVFAAGVFLSIKTFRWE